eukprot:scaffold4663_cov104-Isochrysis_galbana.AAC.2
MGGAAWMGRGVAHCCCWRYRLHSCSQPSVSELTTSRCATSFLAASAVLPCERSSATCARVWRWRRDWWWRGMWGGGAAAGQTGTAGGGRHGGGCSPPPLDTLTPATHLPLDREQIVRILLEDGLVVCHRELKLVLCLPHHRLEAADADRVREASRTTREWAEGSVREQRGALDRRGTWDCGAAAEDGQQQARAAQDGAVLSREP